MPFGLNIVGEDALLELIDSFGDPRIVENRMPEMQQALAKALLEEVQKKFDQGSPDWPTLSMVTQELKGSSQPLVDTGQLRDSFQILDLGEAVFVGIPDGMTRDDGTSMELVAGVQENGATIKVTDKVRNFFAGKGFPLRKTTEVVIIPPRAFFEPSVQAVEERLPDILGPILDKMFDDMTDP